jgi:folate-binding protein YgfZ
MYSNSSMKQRILLKGRDGIDLLKRITTLDPSQLEMNSEHLAVPGLILNPQGKIVSYFEIKKRDADTVEMIGTDALLALLDQYTFGEKYELGKNSVPEDETMLENFSSDLDRISKLTPKIAYEFLEDGSTNPLEVNLRHAIHDNKGCYPGQEVIEKIISLGSPPRKLCLLELLPGENRAESHLEDALPRSILDSATGAEVGTLTSFSKNLGLAIVKRTHQKIGQTFTLNGSPETFSLKQIQN